MASKTIELIEQCHKSAYHAVSLQQPLNSVNQLKSSIDLQWQHGIKGALSSATFAAYHQQTELYALSSRIVL